MKEICMMLIVNAVCGGVIYICMSLVKENYKSIFAPQLMMATGIILTIVTSFKSLFVIGLALAAYILFLVLVNPEPSFPWTMPAIWLAVHGWYLATVKQIATVHVVIFAAVALLAIICPFLGVAQRRLDGEEADEEEFIARRNRLLLWSGFVIGLAACFAVIVIQ